ncbi:hypothetical protein I302_104869 [Kwoniella bestiolae CBS 10118]|uniref:Uncharacterized protein n=1 Tax=Kwoniella bestiolae CBS 10118 TaxID=1296100 RepID=A0A1B9FRI7_9TREE|nr:hypothetical protein I302_09061 [Kwoniella bestiolae CBS 10118]OCF21384.1 hypothetical protein I302_09061 [Kwoniella bestiolae CBS 10118]
MSEHHHNHPSPQDENSDNPSIAEGGLPLPSNPSEWGWLKPPKLHDFDKQGEIPDLLNDMDDWHRRLRETWNQEVPAESPWSPYTAKELVSGRYVPSGTGRATTSQSGGTGSSHEVDGEHREDVPVLGPNDTRPPTSKGRPYRAKIRSGTSRLVPFYNLTEAGALAFHSELDTDVDTSKGSNLTALRTGSAWVGKTSAEDTFYQRGGMSEAKIARLKSIASKDVQGVSGESWCEVDGWI